jgi:hypothetical protein
MKVVVQKIGCQGNISDIYIICFLLPVTLTYKRDDDKCRLCEAAPARKKLHESMRAVVF